MPRTPAVKSTVLDSSALLAFFFDEAGADLVEGLLGEAARSARTVTLCAVNWAEVLYVLRRKLNEPALRAAHDFIRTMPVHIVPADMELAEAAASLKSEHGLGLADAFAAALAMNQASELVTGDLEFKALAGKIRLVWLAGGSSRDA